MTVLDFVPTDIGPSDETPDTTGAEYPCEVCGKEAGPYKGRGRKPKRCADHKRNASGTPKTKGTNATLAGQAADALCQVNGLATVGLMVAGFHATAGAIAERESVFREQAYSALLTDPNLCRVILRAGTTSGKLSLLIAYAMLGIGVGPTAIIEFKDKRGEKEE